MSPIVLDRPLVRRAWGGPPFSRAGSRIFRALEHKKSDCPSVPACEPDRPACYTCLVAQYARSPALPTLLEASALLARFPSWAAESPSLRMSALSLKRPRAAATQTRRRKTEGAEWIACVKCSVWRKLPAGIRAANLSSEWCCAESSWDPLVAAVGCMRPSEEEEEAEDDHSDQVTDASEGDYDEDDDAAAVARSQHASSSSSLRENKNAVGVLLEDLRKGPLNRGKAECASIKEASQLLTDWGIAVSWIAAQGRIRDRLSRGSRFVIYGALARGLLLTLTRARTWAGCVKVVAERGIRRRRKSSKSDEAAE